MKTNLKNFPEASELSSLHKTLNSYEMLCYKYERIEEWKRDFESELREELKKWDKDVKANTMSKWFPDWIRKEILGES